MTNVQKLPQFNQVAVWRATILPENEIKEFEQFFIDEMNTRVQFLESVSTNPDLDKYGKEVPETGGRTDILFAVHEADVMNFAIKRLAFGISWLEDVISKINRGDKLYPSRIKDYTTWNADDSFKEKSYEDYDGDYDQ